MGDSVRERARAQRNSATSISGVHRTAKRDHRHAEAGSLEQSPASILIVDDYPVARASTAASLAADPRFRVHELAGAASVTNLAAQIARRRYEVYVVALERNPVAAYELIRQLRFQDADAVIAAIDDWACTKRARAVSTAGSAHHFVLPIDRTAVHTIATGVELARVRPSQYGDGPVRIRLDTSKLYVDGKVIALGTMTEIKVVEALCRACGQRVHFEQLLIAGGYPTTDQATAALLKLLRRFQAKLGPYADCLVNEHGTWRLELPIVWPRCSCASDDPD